MSRKDIYHAFLCHASEDKTTVVNPIAEKLKKRGLRVWLDQWEIDPGDFLEQTIGEAISCADYGLILFSPSFFQKSWTRRELEWLLEKEAEEKIKLIPIWHEVAESDLELHAPDWLNRHALNTADGLDALIEVLSVKITPDAKHTRIRSHAHLGRFEELEFTSSHHAFAKRYQVAIRLIDIHTPIDMIKEILREVVEEYRKRELYVRGAFKDRWFGQNAHVIWIFVCRTNREYQDKNWICNAQWISETLTLEYQPQKLIGEDLGSGLVVQWADTQHKREQVFQVHHVAKESHLEVVRSIFDELDEIMAQVISWTKAYRSGKLSEHSYHIKVGAISEKVDELYERGGNVGFPPIALQDLHQFLENILASARDIAVMIISEKGRKTWPKANRDYLVNQQLELYGDNASKLKLALAANGY